MQLLNLNLYAIKTKKIPYYLMLFLLMLGASLILGLLSFGGMFELVTGFGLVSIMLGLSMVAFVLCVIYEGAIYWENLKQAFKKLFFKRDYLRRHLAEAYLDELCEKQVKEGEFYRDYVWTKEELERFEGKNLDAAGQVERRYLKKQLHVLKKMFTKHLYEKVDGEADYEKNLNDTISLEEREEQLKLLSLRRGYFHLAKAWSLFSALFMTMLTSYLVIDVVAELTFFSFVISPFILVPMSLIAGIAYGFLTYNSITDLINQETIQKRWASFLKDWEQGKYWLVARTLAVFALACFITASTAGTWYNIVQSTPPLFAWMTSIPSFVMGVTNPSVLSTFIFDVQNASETLDDLDAEAEHGPEAAEKSIRQRLEELWEKEHPLQFFNIFRPLLLLIEPLEKCLFAGHLLSNGVIADRFPGIPAWVTGAAGVAGEYLVDRHYFYKKNCPHHEHEAKHSHNHGDSLPLKVLHLLFLPVYALAALWAFTFSQCNKDESKRIKDFNTAWEAMTGYQKPETVVREEYFQYQTSEAAKTAFAIHRIDRHFQKHKEEGDPKNIAALKTSLKNRQKNISVADCITQVLKQGFFSKNAGDFLSKVAAESAPQAFPSHGL